MRKGEYMKIHKITDEGIMFKNNKTVYLLEDFHETECCEEVYADWTSINEKIVNKNGNNVNIFSLEFYEDIDKLIEEVKEQGFMLCAKDGTKILVNCYDIQNGYYSSDLNITLYEYNEIGSKEISDDNKIHIYR